MIPRDAARMPAHSRRVVLLVSALALVAAACSAAGSGKSASGVLTKAVLPAATTKIGHVFVINLENENFATIGARRRRRST